MAAMATTMLPGPDLLPDVLPTARLNRRAMPVPELRAELRRIPDGRNALSVVVLWSELVGIAGGVVWLTHRAGWAAPLVWLAALVLLGSMHARFAILGHEAAHRLLFSVKRWNDLIGRWLLAYPGLVAFEAYRRVHFAHHREEFGPDEPDLNLYNGYPITRASLRRKLVRDAVGISGWKNLRPLFSALRRPASRPVAARIVGTQVVLLLICTVAGYPLLYVLWLGSWLTSWRVINRLRAVAEHGGMTRSEDRRLTTHHVRQSWFARFWLVPFHTGWHLAHHVDMGVPWRSLPRLHTELVTSGWVPEPLEYPNYRALWRQLSSRPEPAPSPAAAAAADVVAATGHRGE
jgi:fatty acid desaturase